MRKKPTKSIVCVERNRRMNTAEEFLQILSPQNIVWKDTYRDWIFRGVGDGVKWHLVPPALRQHYHVFKYTSKIPVNASTLIGQIDLEYGLLWEFFRVADRQGLLIPEDSQMYRSPWAHRTIDKRLKEAKKGIGPWPFDELMSGSPCTASWSAYEASGLVQ